MITKSDRNYINDTTLTLMLANFVREDCVINIELINGKTISGKIVEANIDQDINIVIIDSLINQSENSIRHFINGSKIVSFNK